MTSSPETDAPAATPETVRAPKVSPQNLYPAPSALTYRTQIDKLRRDTSNPKP